MRAFLWLIALFAVAIMLALLAQFNPGNVVLFYPPYRIDMSLNMALFVLALVYLLLYGVMRAVAAARQMPVLVAEYRHKRREREANKALREALRCLLEGRFGHAEKAAWRAAELPENASLAALIGARAAHHMQQSARRDAWFARMQSDASHKTARLMLMTELLVDERKPLAALEAVRELNASGMRHIHAQQLALKASQQARQWPEVLRLVKSLDKRHALHPALSTRLREMAYEDLLADKSLDGEGLQRVWSQVAADDRKKPFVAALAAQAFNARGLHDKAAAIVEAALEAEWDERLVRAYRAAAAAEGSATLLQQIENCEGWLKKRPTDAELALTLGALCLKQKLWGKAHRFLEQALSDAQDAAMLREAHLKLAQLHDALQHSEEAANHYRQCALASTLDGIL
ncbi:heme biosynthesis HemY N-terminal domain-containing protein [Massilia sp. W12]|uniref:heme biosynthesis HemY N-terminal domain-containing protein n=1 Tax=Massilia sp. W12 TaxID=3126507 RepID=UPI0030CB6F4C